jgi:hypothetical protein
MDVAREPIELSDHDRRPELLRVAQCLGQLRSTLERVGTLAGLNSVNSPAIARPSTSAKRAMAAR